MRRPSGSLIAIILLSVALATAAAFVVVYLVQLGDANARIVQQKHELKKQHDLIEKKETYGAAVQGLLDTEAKFDGVQMTALVPVDHYETLVRREWLHRWKPVAIDGDIADIKDATKDLQALLDTATAEAASNGSGSAYEATIDQLGGGFVVARVDDASSLCSGDVLACVLDEDPYTVHIDAAGVGEPYMTDFLRTGISYHEFAHVLQDTNPEPTVKAVAAFGGDYETMADCFALTYLPGWKLDQRIWTSSYEYWDVSIGYGYTCTEAQKQVVRDWRDSLAFHPQPLSQ